MKKFKKLLSAATAVMMLSQTCMFAWPAHAENELTIAPADLCTTKEGLVPGYTLKLTGADDGTEITWEQASSEDGDYAAISGAAGTEYTLLNAQGSKWVRAKAGENTSNALKIGAAAGYRGWYYLWSDNDEYVPKTGPAQYRFSVEDTTYVLLADKEVNGEKQYLVYRAESAGKTDYDSDGTRRFDPNDSGNVAYKLNTEGQPLYDAIETEIKTYAQRSDWVTLKGGGSATDITDNYVTYSKFAILDSHELTDTGSNGQGSGGYSVRLGYEDLYAGTQANDGAWLRDSFSTSGHRLIRHRGVTSKDPIFRAYSGQIEASDKGEYNVYPICWISGDFFENVRVNGGGADVMKAVEYETRGENQYETLSKLGYSDSEIEAMGVTLPEDRTVILSGTARPGFTLTVTDNAGMAVTEEVTWTYEDGTPLAANTNAVEEGEYTVGIAVGSYTIKEADAGKRIKASVTADGKSYELLSDVVAAPLAEVNINQIVSGLAEKADANYRFSLKDGKDGTNNYMLLDTVVENGQKKHMIIALDVYAQTKWDLGGVQRFDPNNTQNVAYLLNEIILKGKAPDEGGPANKNTVRYLPEVWRTYILDNLWVTEGGHAVVTEGEYAGKTVGTEDYVTKAKVAIMSNAELTKYAGIYGMNSGMWLRTPAKWSNKDAAINVSVEGRVNAGKGSINGSEIAVRPIFYVGDEFFRSVALCDMGTVVRTAVKNAIGSDWDATELYTAEEKAEIDAPFVKFDGLYSGETELKNTTADGVTTSTFTGKTEATAKYFLGSVTDSNAALIIAVYEGDVLKGVAAKNVTLPAGTGVKESVTVSGFDAATEDTSIKAFVWDSVLGLKPLSEENSLAAPSGK